MNFSRGLPHTPATLLHYPHSSQGTCCDFYCWPSQPWIPSHCPPSLDFLESLLVHVLLLCKSEYKVSPLPEAFPHPLYFNTAVLPWSHKALWLYHLDDSYFRYYFTLIKYVLNYIIKYSKKINKKCKKRFLPPHPSTHNPSAQTVEYLRLSF